ncbi:hypothetical protein fugu_017413 [Takifugu bimaculatus]|uniref:Cell death regulator Aven n=1 Tax=Takifugu bimaculatus TaxID=433685 RepID=A0A4Z2BQV9_9TELE|nr:hypothetical protein fugu_017413 [Takifugu bimaculatus]
MEGRPNSGRGGSWKKVDRGAINSGEHRGRGRGSHHRGRGKRNYYRGHGRGENIHAFHPPEQSEEEGHQEDDCGLGNFSRRKLESNWDRYEQSEKPDSGDDIPTRRGTDYHVLLESAGDSFTQFRFSEEKEWDMDSFAASQPSTAFVDLIALAQILQELPVHQRLNLDADLGQVLTPSHLPTVSFTPKPEVSKLDFAPPLAEFRKLATKVPAVTKAHTPVSSNTAASPPAEDDDEEELDQLLNLKKPVVGNQQDTGAEEENPAPEKDCEDVKEVTEKEVVKGKDITPPEPTSVRKEVTEEDLEDWLDSMIS